MGVQATALVLGIAETSRSSPYAGGRMDGTIRTDVYLNRWADQGRVAGVLADLPDLVRAPVCGDGYVAAYRRCAS